MYMYIQQELYYLVWRLYMFKMVLCIHVVFLSIVVRIQGNRKSLMQSRHVHVFVSEVFKHCLKDIIVEQRLFLNL